MLKLHLLYGRNLTRSVKLYSRVLLSTTLRSCKAEPRHTLGNSIMEHNMFVHKM